MKKKPELKHRSNFHRALLAWYKKHKRDLPWRKTREPYKVLVSEIMLQQTQVDRVLPKYREFLKKYPTISKLAGSSVQDVKRTWYPLGYNIRPVRLHGIACEVKQNYGGRIPDSKEKLLELKGIGKYTAGAVLTFAFGKDEPMIDTNIRRLIHRVFVGSEKVKGWKMTSAKMWELAETLVPKGKSYDYHQALMDFGAMNCKAQRPICQACPMNTFCKAYKSFAK